MQDDELSMKSGSPDPSRPPSPDLMEIDPPNGNSNRIDGNPADIMI